VVELKESRAPRRVPLQASGVVYSVDVGREL